MGAVSSALSVVRSAQRRALEGLRRVPRAVLAVAAVGFVLGLVLVPLLRGDTPTVVAVPPDDPIADLPALDADAPLPPFRDSPLPDVTVALAGDVHGEPPIEGLLQGGRNPLEDAADRLSAADLAVVNLETAVGTEGAPVSDKSFTFQADPALLPALAAAGVDAVTVANNHALDYGTAGLLDTLRRARDAGVAVVGGGTDAEEAYAAHVVDVGGQRVALVGLSETFPLVEWAATDERAGLASAYDVQAATAAVRAATRQAELVVVTIHWGSELQDCPNERQLRLAKALLLAGADVIAGHHPHVLQPVQVVNGRVVAYSLGNFSFYNSDGVKGLTGTLEVTLDGTGVNGWSFAPYRIDDRGRPQPADEDDARAVADRLGDGNGCELPALFREPDAAGDTPTGATPAAARAGG